jgi:type II secretion system protein H
MQFQKNDKSGFTLIELMVVVVLIGVVTAVILPEMRGTYEDALLRSTGRKIMSVSSLAASRAVATSREQRLKFDVQNGRYELKSVSRGGNKSGDDQKPDLNEQGDLDKRIAIQIRGPTESEPKTDQIEEDRKTAGDSIAFYADGTAESKDVLLRDRQGFTLALKMNPTTARFRIVQVRQE